MPDSRFCRFAVQFAVNGYTMIDGVLSATAIDQIINDYLRDMETPPIYLGALKDAKKGYHIAYDIVSNGRLIALEISALTERPENPQQKQIGHQPPT